MISRTYPETLLLVQRYWIVPIKCHGCGQTEENWSPGHDDGTDRKYVGYQCRDCGHIQGLTLATILRRIRDHS